jgi:hypothetical protein
VPDRGGYGVAETAAQKGTTLQHEVPEAKPPVPDVAPPPVSGEIHAFVPCLG